MPQGLAATRQFGQRLEATVIYLKQTQHLSYERVVQAMQYLHDVALSEGVVSAILVRAGVAAQDVAATIKADVQASAVIHSDETSARVNGLT